VTSSSLPPGPRDRRRRGAVVVLAAALLVAMLGMVFEEIITNPKVRLVQ
jgi:hypothetical protein